MTKIKQSTNGLWMAFSRMNHPYFPNTEITFTSGKGAYLVDSKGNTYFDGFSTLWTNLVGHGREEVIEAMTSQMHNLSFMHVFSGTQHEPAQRLSERLVEGSPFGHRHVFFGCSGSDATETAIKLARNYWFAKRQPQKNIVVGRMVSYHGTSYGALSLMAASWTVVSMSTSVGSVNPNSLAILSMSRVMSWAPFSPNRFRNSSIFV